MATTITLGLTTWTEHPALIHHQQRPVTLNEYAQSLPTVEVDTFFYALPQMSTIQNWLSQVPADFQFIIKAHQGMTLHQKDQQRGELEELFRQYRRTISPLVAAGQLKTILFQFPPYFDARLKDIDYLRLVRLWMGDLPIAIELRNNSWYQPGVIDSLLDYCQELNFTLVAADEPHDTVTSVPFYLATTSSQLALIRLHGRNREGWDHAGKEWRKKRTLYKYSQQELDELARQIIGLHPQPQEVCVIFNNNSGGDAAPNALSLQSIMDLHFQGLAPKSPEQLDLF